MTSPADDGTTGRKRLGVVVLGVAVVALVVVAIALLADDSDDDEVMVGTTTTAVEDAGETTTTEPDATTTMIEAETTSTTSTTGTVDSPRAVFPFASDDTRFDDPFDAAQAWAEGVVGFVDPVYSGFRQGDSRSGEVEVRPSEDGPATTILLRQLDDTWWVLGSVAETIEVSEPEAFDDVASPLALRGEVNSPAGTMEVELWTDAADQPLAMTTTTAGTDQLAPFEATLQWGQSPQTRSGALLLRTRDAGTGAVHGATVLRVHFGGG